MNNPLTAFGDIPLTASAIESPDIKRGNQKLRLLERAGQIIRLKKGLYMCSPALTGSALSNELIANRLYSRLFHFRIISIEPTVF